MTCAGLGNQRSQPVFRVHHWFTVLSSIICSQCQTTATSESLTCDFNYIIPFLRSVSARCIGHLGLFTFSVLEDNSRGNMIVHIVINNKDGIMFPLLMVLLEIWC